MSAALAFSVEPAGGFPAATFGQRAFQRSSFAVQAWIGHVGVVLQPTGLLLADNDDRAASEAEEMRRIAAGDASAFARVVDREAPRLLRFAFGILGSMEEAEDVVQDSLVRLLENAAGWTPDARIGTWLYRVCYNRAIDSLRRRRAFVEESVLEAVPDGAERADVALVRSETTLTVRAAIERLPSRQRTAVLLFHIQGLSQRDAAEVMSVSEAAFESMLSRARRQLRGWLSEAHDD